MRGRAAAAACGLFLAGCGSGVHGAAPDRARDTVASFAAACSRGQWQAAGELLTGEARRVLIAHGDPATGCGAVLGVDRGALGDERAARAAMAATRIDSVRVHGDEGRVAVTVAGARGTAELTDSGQRFRIALPLG